MITVPCFECGEPIERPDNEPLLADGTPVWGVGHAVCPSLAASREVGR